MTKEIIFHPAGSEATPRIYSDNYLKLVLTVARDHLPAVWICPTELAWMGNEALPIVPFSKCFADRELTSEVDLREPTKRIVFNREDESNRVVVVATLAIPIPDGGTILIRHDMSAIFIMPTTVSEHPNGVLQLFGAEPGVILLTGEQIRDQLGRKQRLIRGTNLKAFSAEQRHPPGAWTSSTISIPLEHVKSIE